MYISATKVTRDPGTLQSSLERGSFSPLSTSAAREKFAWRHWYYPGLYANNALIHFEARVLASSWSWLGATGLQAIGAGSST